MSASFSNLVNVFATPTDVFDNLKERPRWLVAFVVISLISIAVGWFIFPFSQQIVYAALSGRFSGQQLDQAVAMSGRFKYIGILFAPVGLLIKWVIVAALLYFMCRLLETPHEIKYKTIFSIVAVSEMILLFMSVVNVLILYVRGIGAVSTPADLQPVQIFAGLDFLVKNASKNLPLFTFLGNVNIFAVWYIITLTVGISVVTGYRKLKSVLIVTGVWFLAVAFQVIMSFISSNSPLSRGM